MCICGVEGGRTGVAECRVGKSSRQGSVDGGRRSGVVNIDGGKKME